MFQNITLFAKRHNILSHPGPHWTIKTRIYCTAELQLGFGAIARWTQQNPIKLTAMISFYKKLSGSRYSQDETLHSFQFDKSTSVRWKVQPDHKTVIQVYYKEYRHWDKTYTSKEELLIEKTVSSGLVASYAADFFKSVMRMLMIGDAGDICIFFADIIDWDRPSAKAEFKIGQRVSTIIGPNVKTQRTGYIINYGYHHNDKTYLYFLMVDGEIRTKRYLPGDLCPAPLS